MRFSVSCADAPKLIPTLRSRSNRPLAVMWKWLLLFRQKVFIDAIMLLREFLVADALIES
jgi:hypothetical protein